MTYKSILAYLGIGIFATYFRLIFGDNGNLKMFRTSLICIYFVVADFNLNHANTSIWLSAAAYCGSSDYLNRNFTGPTKGFVVTTVIEDKQFDTEGLHTLYCRRALHFNPT